MITRNINTQTFKGMYLTGNKEHTAAKINDITQNNVGDELYYSDTKNHADFSEKHRLFGKILGSEKVDANISYEEIAKEHILVSLTDKIDRTHLGTVKMFKKGDKLECIAFPPYQGDNMQCKIDISGQSIISFLDYVAEKLLKTKVETLADQLQTKIRRSVGEIDKEITAHYNDHIYSSGDTNQAWEDKTEIIDPNLKRISALTEEFKKLMLKYSGL